MRIWDQIEPKLLCRQHLLGEHRELHGLWNVILHIENGQSPGYSRHPETLRWSGHESALRQRHQQLVAEMKDRGWKHNSPLPKLEAEQDSSTVFPAPLDDQLSALKLKECQCQI